MRLRSANAVSTSLVFLGLLGLLGGCATAGSGSADPETPLSYGDEARGAYEEALITFRQGNCLEAEPKFASVRRRFPYSRFAALAELRIADCKFDTEAYAEAITAYRQFIRFRPSHDEVAYARFRIAESYFEQIPSDWFLAPPSYERDQGATQDALRQLRRFILDFQDDPRVPEARRMEQQCLRALANHELYAARFYRSRRAYRATIARCQTLLTAYHGSGIEAEALLLMGEAFRELDEDDRAAAVFEDLIENYPDSEEAGDARGQLSSIR